ncbi:MAG: TMEM175 family protein [Solirubrobacterales bacterium]|nr:TMEM175 family protein [Solirubrobacterales bacterium]
MSDFERGNYGSTSAVLRTELFSDAVFAIALTLLAVDLTVTGDVPGKLGQGLADRWAQYLAFLGSFLFIAVMWLNHHAAFQRLKAAPTTFLWANFGVLLGAVLLPFPTRLLAGAFEHGNLGDEQVAIVLYAGIAAATGLAWAMLWFVISRHPDMWSSPNDGPLWSEALRRSVQGALAYVVAGLIGLVTAPEVALAAFAVLPLWRRKTGRLLASS